MKTTTKTTPKGKTAPALAGLIAQVAKANSTAKEAATKAATVKATTKAATKAAPTVKAESKKIVTTKAFKFLDGARPSSGARLFAHTQAVLSYLGLDKGLACKQDALKTLWGSKAVSYHGARGNLSSTNSMIKLTAQGLNFFSQRVAMGTADKDATAAFKDAITKGTLNDKHGIKKGHAIECVLSIR